MDKTLALVYRGIGQLEPMTVPIPGIPGASVRVEMKACGICGSDVKYFKGENPWALHTLGENREPPSNMILGHEVSGIVVSPNENRRVAILAFKSCGVCPFCRSNRENLCPDMQHFGHSAGWNSMKYYPGGMSGHFDIWQDSAFEIPDSISFEAATFLDGLAVAVHALETGGFSAGKKIGVIGLGPIGMLIAQAAGCLGAEEVFGFDVYDTPIRLAHKIGIKHAVSIKEVNPEAYIRSTVGDTSALDLVFDTVGSDTSIRQGLNLLAPSGTLVLMAVREEPVSLKPIRISGERRILSSANNLYGDFPKAINLLAKGKIKVEPLITHRFHLSEGMKAFDVMLRKEEEDAYKVILHS